MILQPQDIINQGDSLVFSDGTQDYVSPDMIGKAAETYLKYPDIIEIRRETCW